MASGEWNKGLLFAVDVHVGVVLRNVEDFVVRGLVNLCHLCASSLAFKMLTHPLEFAGYFCKKTDS
jgi:hypothetical protein